MTLSVSILASQDQQDEQQAAVAGAAGATSVSAPPTAPNGVVRRVRAEEAPQEAGSAGAAASETPPPSEQDQLQVLGVYSTALIATPKLGSSAASEERRANLDRMLAKDDTLESLKILQMVDAPRQVVAESEL